MKHEMMAVDCRGVIMNMVGRMACFHAEWPPLLCDTYEMSNKKEVAKIVEELNISKVS